MKQLLFAAGLSLPLLFASTSCGSATDGPGSSTVAANAVIDHSTHAVKCGCSVTEIGACGNYIEIAGELYAINGEQGEGAKLGHMEWCGIDGAQAEVEGEIKDGEFIATYIKTIQP